MLRSPLFALAILLPSCASGAPRLGGDVGLNIVQASDLPAPGKADVTGSQKKPYYVGAYDKLVINVYGLPGLSDRNVQVDSTGQIAVPIAGRLDVDGKTTAEISELLAAQLRANYVRSPQVTVELQEAPGRLVTVEGQVAKPGLYPVADRTTLLRTMAVAGGLTEFARIDDIVVFRTVDGKRLAALYNLKRIRQGAYPDPDIYPNDVVVVGDSAARRLFKDLLQVTPTLMAPLVLAVGR